MTPAEQVGWEVHFQKFPHGDFYTQSILARGFAWVLQTLGNDIDEFDLAPHLKPFEEQIAEQNKKEKAAVDLNKSIMKRTVEELQKRDKKE